MYHQIAKNASQYIYTYVYIFFPLSKLLSNISQNFGEWKNVSQMSQDQHSSSNPKTKVGKTKETKKNRCPNSLPRFTVIHNISQSLKNYLKN